MCEGTLQQLEHLLVQNRRWAARMEEKDPHFFNALAEHQNPDYLWIGCSDSRVPANVIVDLMPGDLFVHRNVANVVVHTDHNCLSVMQYAVEALKVKHIMVVGHYGCGGVQAVLEGAEFGLIDNWLRHVEDIKEQHQSLLDKIPSHQRLNALCEINVIEQMRNVCRSNVVKEAWDNGQSLCVHGWIYGLKDGVIHPLGHAVEKAEMLKSVYQSALQSVIERYT